MANSNGAETDTPPELPLQDAGTQADTNSAALSADRDGYSASLDVDKFRRKDFIKEGFHNKTKGELFFNRVVYGGIGFGIVTGVSIFMTWLMRDTSYIGNKYSNLVKMVSDKLKGNRTGAAAENFHNAVDSAMTIATLFTGGTIATVLPVKAMEDRKASYVKSFDNHFYGKERVAADPEIQAAHHELEVAPRQTWRSVFWSRVVAFIGTFTVWGLVGENSRPLSKKLGGSIDSASIKSGRAVDGFFRRSHKADIDHMKSISPNDMRRKLVPEKGIDAVDPVSTRLWNYIVQDGMYTALTSALLFVSTRILGPVFDKPHSQNDKHPQKQPAPEPASPIIAENDNPRARANDNDKPQTKLSADNIAQVDKLAERSVALGAS